MTESDRFSELLKLGLPFPPQDMSRIPCWLRKSIWKQTNKSASWFKLPELPTELLATAVGIAATCTRRKSLSSFLLLSWFYLSRHGFQIQQIWVKLGSWQKIRNYVSKVRNVSFQPRFRFTNTKSKRHTPQNLLKLVTKPLQGWERSHFTKANYSSE